MNKEDLIDEFRFCNAIEEFCSLSIHEPFFLEGLEQEVKWLASHFLGFQSALRYQNACATAGDFPDDWSEIGESNINDVRMAAVEAKRIIDEFIVKTTQYQWTKDHHSFKKSIYFISGSNWKAKKAAIKKQLVSIIERRPSLMNIDWGLKMKMEMDAEKYAWRISRERKKTSRDLSYDDIVGREDDDKDENMKVILEMLMISKENDEQKLRVVSVVGMPGIGKTTISRKIYNNNCIRSHFGFRAWVSHGASEIRKVVRVINSLHWKPRYLIVIDDFATLRYWKDAKELLASCDTLNESRILLNTRNERLASKAILEDEGTSPSPNILGPLNDVHCWELFIKKVCPNPLPPNLASIGVENSPT